MRLILDLPEGTKGGVVTILVTKEDGGLAMTTRSLDTPAMSDGNLIKIKLEEEIRCN